MISVSGKRLPLAAGSFFLLLLSCASATDAQTVTVWPNPANPVVSFTLGKLHALQSVDHQQAYSVDTQVQNLWGKPIPQAIFALYLFDRKNVRVGEGVITISNLAPGDTARFPTSIMASGEAVSMKLEPQSLPDELESLLPHKSIFVFVNSVPQGAHFTLDGRDAGTTPQPTDVTVGTHILEFDKEGFNRGKYLFSVGPDDSGSNLSYELTAATQTHDTIEMRDGTTVNGELQWISATDVVIKVDGKTQTLDRAQVRRITLAYHKPEARETP
jgi:hypothetical protein